jgi:hypothetical protein
MAIIWLIRENNLKIEFLKNEVNIEPDPVPESAAFPNKRCGSGDAVVVCLDKKCSSPRYEVAWPSFIPNEKHGVQSSVSI